MSPWRGALLLLLLAAAATPARTEPSGSQQSYALSVHFTTTSPAGCFALTDAALTDCDVIRPNGFPSGTFRWAWIVLTGVPDGTGPGSAGGLAEISFGIEHDLGEEVAWGGCGTSEVKSLGWPLSGGGLTVTWPEGCHLVEDNTIGGTAVGALVIESDATGIIQVIAHPEKGRAEATDCAGSTVPVCPNMLGSGDAAPAGTLGMPACGFECTTPVEEVTWGRIKAAFDS